MIQSMVTLSYAMLQGEHVPADVHEVPSRFKIAMVESYIQGRHGRNRRLYGERRLARRHRDTVSWRDWLLLSPDAPPIAD